MVDVRIEHKNKTKQNKTKALLLVHRQPMENRSDKRDYDRSFSMKIEKQRSQDQGSKDPILVKVQFTVFITKQKVNSVERKCNSENVWSNWSESKSSD